MKLERVRLTPRQATRQGHSDVVDLLIQAGASLGGLDGNLAPILANTALRSGDQNGFDLWVKVGAPI